MKQSVIYQLDAIDKNLESVQKFSVGDQAGGFGALLGGISAVLNSLEVIDVTGTFAADIAAGRAAVTAQDVAAGLAAVASARAKLV